VINIHLILIIKIKLLISKSLNNIYTYKCLNCKNDYESEFNNIIVTICDSCNGADNLTDTDIDFDDSEDDY
jgi:hypothetical protein